MDQISPDFEATPAVTPLPPIIADWFAGRGWTPRRHQLDLLATVQAGRAALLIAPTGGGKTLAGFLPSLVDLAGKTDAKAATRPARLHTLYLSPLKALAVDVARNVETPVREMGLPVTVETRTGDTPGHKRTRQRHAPPDILMTTPEQLSLLVAYRDARLLFSTLKYIVLDELHALVNNKRGELLALALARITRFAPRCLRIGLSATVAHPEPLRRYLLPQVQGAPPAMANLVMGEAGVPPEVTVLASQAHIPWSGHSARHAYAEVYDVIRRNHTCLVFVNTRSQAETVFQELWRLNEDNLPIALHHGSLAVEQRRKVENAMAAGALRAVVCTSTLDLGVDWGKVDLVVQIGAPKGASRLTQRIGRSNHRLDQPSRALLVPANRFEVLECEAARTACREGALDGEPPRSGGFDVLAQHILGVACGEPFDVDELYAEVLSAEPFTRLSRATFDRIVAFVATGGYALERYEKYKRIRKDKSGRYTVTNRAIAQQYRLNVGTIVEEPMVTIRLVRKYAARTSALRGGRKLGQTEEYFIEQLVPGDTFLFAGEILRFEGLQEAEAYVTRTSDEAPRVPAYMGGKFPLSTYLADRVRHLLADPRSWKSMPPAVAEWLGYQDMRSVLPRPDQLLVETFPHTDKYYMVMYPFDGRLAHQSLGMLLTRRLDRLGMHPLGFVASEYALAIWGLRDMAEVDLASLFDEDMMGDDLDAWLAESNLYKRTFRTCAIIAGLIERRFPGQEKTGRQVTFSSDLIYDVLREHEPDHILLQATYQDAAQGLLDIARLNQLLTRISGNIVASRLTRVSPLAVPVLLDIGKESVHGAVSEKLLKEAAQDLIDEAMRLDNDPPNNNDTPSNNDPPSNKRTRTLQ